LILFGGLGSMLLFCDMRRRDIKLYSTKHSLIAVIMLCCYLILTVVCTACGVLLLISDKKQQQQFIATIFSQLWRIAGSLGRNRMQDSLNCCGLTAPNDHAVDSASCPVTISPAFASITKQPGCLPRVLAMANMASPLLIAAFFLLAAVNFLVGFLAEFIKRRRLAIRQQTINTTSTTLTAAVNSSTTYAQPSSSSPLLIV
jgi:hypothetical protein